MSCRIYTILSLIWFYLPFFFTYSWREMETLCGEMEAVVTAEENCCKKVQKMYDNPCNFVFLQLDCSCSVGCHRV